jgi:rhamnogalacturonyl hydrolase YesR
MIIMRKGLLFLLSLVFSYQVSFSQKSLLTNFPTGAKPEEVGKLLGYRFVYGDYSLHGGKWINYPMTFYWNGSFRFAELSKDKDLHKYLISKFEPLFTKDDKYLPIMNHVDLNMFGSLPLEIYRITKEKRYFDLGIPYADTQWQVPEDAKDEEKGWAAKGYSWQTRLWIDDMYMITIVQTQAYRVTKEMKYLDRAAKEMVMYLDELQRPNGLFYHAPDVPFYWARGNGWMAAGMTELLRYLPKNHEHYARIMEGYHIMMKSLLEYQTPGGMWNQLIDKSDIWAETSGTAMFTYAFIVGVKQGWLDANVYAPAARKAWLAMITYIDYKGAVSDVCVGTNKKNEEQYYYDRPRRTGDYHGQAPYMWCVNALIEK